MFNFLIKQTTQPAAKTTQRKRKPATRAQQMYEIAGYNLPVIKSARRKSIAVKRNKNSLVIEVPKFLSKVLIQETLNKHQSWLLNQINQHQRAEQTLFTGLPGQSFEFLGQTYYCHWLDEPLENKRKLSDFKVCEQSQSLQMTFKKGLDKTKKQQLSLQAVESFFKTQAKSYFHNKTELLAEQMQLDYHSITIKAYKSRWGSCYPDGRLQYNWRLMQAPSWVVDYVVVHELAHRIHANHSRAFWDVVEHYYPATPQAKQQLKEQGPRWIQLLEYDHLNLKRA